MSKIEINATRSKLYIVAEGYVALVIGIAIAFGGFVATLHYFPI